MLCNLLKTDSLGILHIDEIFFFYEEPQLFSCESETGQKYLAMLTDMDIKEWLLVPLSKEQLFQLKDSRITAREVYMNSEKKVIWKIVSNGNSGLLKKIFPNDLLKSDLPEC